MDLEPQPIFQQVAQLVLAYLDGDHTGSQLWLAALFPDPQAQQATRILLGLLAASVQDDPARRRRLQEGLSRMARRWA